MIHRKMARPKNLSAQEIPGLFTPSITRETALSRMGRFVDQIPELRSKGRNSAFLTTWKQNVEGTLHAYYGPGSLQLTQFRKIHFSPTSFVIGGPESHFVEAFLHGAEVAESYLRSRISELKEEATEITLQPQEEATVNRDITRKVFVVHGHDHGSKETVARFLSQLELDPIILHEKANEGRTIIE